MSSVAAMLSRRAEDHRDRVREMLAAAPHRGQRIELVTLGECTLGISNPDDWEESVLASRDELAICFTGRLDNRADLSRDLRGDAPSVGEAAALPDLLLAAFRTFGIGLPNHLRGTYAVVLTDGRQLWCFRDHLGFRPLFCREDAGGIYVASEAKQVVAGEREAILEKGRRDAKKVKDEGMKNFEKAVERLVGKFKGALDA